MKKIFSISALTLVSLLLFALPDFAAEIPKSLEGVMNLQHPASNLYTAGQPKPDAFAAFTKAGVAHVINLRPRQETPELDEASIVAKAGMTYYNIPIAGASDLTRDNVKQLDALLVKFGNEPVLIHCSSGNRVGALMALRAAWLHNASIDEAIKTGESYGLTKLLPDVKKLLAEQHGQQNK
jgi:uncharacterized protein (TIGR01244 family)